MARNQRDENLTIISNQGQVEPIRISGSNTTANATNNVTISNVAPAGVGTATISAWLPISVDGTTYYIPMWT